MRRRRSRESGQATVELAIVSMVLLLLSLGAVQFGKLYSIKLRVVHAAREGARYAALKVQTTGLDEIKDHTVAAAPDLGLSRANVTISMSTTPTGELQTGAVTPVVDNRVSVLVNYTYVPDVPLAKYLLPAQMSIPGRVEMRIGG